MAAMNKAPRGLARSEDDPADEEETVSQDAEGAPPDEELEDEESDDDTDDAPPDDEEADDGAGGDSIDGRKSNASAEDQQLYNDFVLNGHIAIYEDKKRFDSIVKRLRMGAEQNDPVGALASVALIIVQRLESGAPNGQKIDSGVLMQGGAEIGLELAEVAEKAGIHKYSDDDIRNAIVRAADQYRLSQAKEGKTDPEEAKREVERLKEADASGDLAKEFPGMAEMFAGSAEGAPPPGAEQPAEQQPYRGLGG